ncbi:MAG: ketopantoate reductase family protein [Halolamina sp.]
MDVVVFGAGSLGSLVGGLLSRYPAHDVTLVGRDPHVAAVRADGLRVVGEIETTVTPAATTDGTGLDADVAVVTVKAHDTAAAAAALSTGDVDRVVSLQNGLTEERLRDRLDGPTVLAGTSTYGAVLESPGTVACTGVGRLAVGAVEGGPSRAADRVGAALRAADVDCVVAEDMPRRRWRKLAVNAGINAVTALARVDNGALVDGDAPAGRIGRRAAAETARVARAEGVDLAAEDAEAAVGDVAADTAANSSSMRQDVAAGRRTEIEAIAGEVVARGRARGVATPTVETLLEVVRAWERGAGVRGSEAAGDGER